LRSLGPGASAGRRSSSASHNRACHGNSTSWSTPSVLVSLVFLLFVALPLVGQDGTLPQTLREHARQIGCSEVGGFYDHPGRVDPPYVWGYVDSTLDRFGERSAVYWCDRKAGPERYLLVVWVSDTSLATAQRCPPTIAWHNHPYGLHLLRNCRGTALGGRERRIRDPHDQ